MEKFSEKSLLKLGDYYVYGLIDPRNHQFFYIGKGKENRVFEHELAEPGDKESAKLQKIDEIKKAGEHVKKVILHCGLTEQEAFAAEAALINAFSYTGEEQLTNIVSGHRAEEAMTVEEFERLHGAIELTEQDIQHKIMVIKINKLYRRGMDEQELYNAIRGVWRASRKNAECVDYVFGVYNALIVAVYKPTHWYICREHPDRRPRPDEDLTPKLEDRLFFEDEAFEKGETEDENMKFYRWKSIAGLKYNQRAQNPISYLNPGK